MSVIAVGFTGMCGHRKIWKSCSQNARLVRGIGEIPHNLKIISKHWSFICIQFLNVLWLMFTIAWHRTMNVTSWFFSTVLPCCSPDYFHTPLHHLQFHPWPLSAFFSKSWNITKCSNTPELNNLLKVKSLLALRFLYIALPAWLDEACHSPDTPGRCRTRQVPSLPLCSGCVPPGSAEDTDATPQHEQ